MIMSDLARQQGQQNFETSLKRLEDIVQELERGNLPLETSLARYEEGVHRLKQCYQILDSVERKISLLSKKDDGNFQEDIFNPKEGNSSYS